LCEGQKKVSFSLTNESSAPSGRPLSPKAPNVAWALAQRGLTPGQTKTLAKIADRARLIGGRLICFPSLTTIAKDAEMTVNGVIKGIDKLVAKKKIAKVTDPADRSAYLAAAGAHPRCRSNVYIILRPSSAHHQEAEAIQPRVSELKALQLSVSELSSCSEMLVTAAAPVKDGLSSLSSAHLVNPDTQLSWDESSNGFLSLEPSPHSINHSSTTQQPYRAREDVVESQESQSTESPIAPSPTAPSALPALLKGAPVDAAGKRSPARTASSAASSALAAWNSKLGDRLGHEAMTSKLAVLLDARAKDAERTGKTLDDVWVMVANSRWLMGDVKEWHATLAWVLRKEKFAEIIAGKFKPDRQKPASTTIDPSTDACGIIATIRGLPPGELSDADGEPWDIQWWHVSGEDAKRIEIHEYVVRSLSKLATLGKFPTTWCGGWEKYFEWRRAGIPFRAIAQTIEKLAAWDQYPSPCAATLNYFHKQVMAIGPEYSPIHTPVPPPRDMTIPLDPDDPHQISAWAAGDAEKERQAREIAAVGQLPAGWTKGYWEDLDYIRGYGHSHEAIVAGVAEVVARTDYNPLKVPSLMRFLWAIIDQTRKLHKAANPDPPPPSPTPTLADLKELEGITPELDAAVDAARREFDATWTEEAQAKFLDLIEKRNVARLAVWHARRAQTSSAIQGATADTGADPIPYIDGWHPPIPAMQPAGSESYVRAA
jgi:hypothetical protein